MTPATESMDQSERLLVKYPLFKTATARIQACFDSYDATAEPDCCPIVGESGSGKTTIISYFSGLHPRADHKWGVEVPVLIAKVPARPTVKSLAETLLYQLGDPLWSRGNTVKKSIRLRELLKRCYVRLLALDEFQHFVTPSLATGVRASATRSGAIGRSPGAVPTRRSRPRKPRSPGRATARAVTRTRTRTPTPSSRASTNSVLAGRS